MQDPQIEPDDQRCREHGSEPESLPPARRPVRQVYHLAKRIWNPTPVPKPVITTDLEYLTCPMSRRR